MFICPHRMNQIQVWQVAIISFSITTDLGIRYLTEYTWILAVTIAYYG